MEITLNNGVGVRFQSWNHSLGIEINKLQYFQEGSSNFEFKYFEVKVLE